ncbi:hypothetical protein SNEBB_003315 [Seison nebaliae]|nr:hypothetical protein SNEBB_003315 [Seison nebaliae]
MFNVDDILQKLNDDNDSKMENNENMEKEEISSNSLSNHHILMNRLLEQLITTVCSIDKSASITNSPPLPDCSTKQNDFHCCNFYDNCHRKCRRVRTVFTEKQLKYLEERFAAQKYLSSEDRKELSRQMSLSQLQIKTWFQNRRMKWKKEVMGKGGLEIPTKPKGRPKKNSIPSFDKLLYHCPDHKLS